MEKHRAVELVEVARLLLLIQGAIAAVTAVEATFVGSLTGAMLPALLTAGFAVWTLILAARLERMSRRVRRWVVVLQVLWLAGAAVDLALAVLMAQTGLGLVPTLTRLALPVSIFVLLRRPSVRAAYGIKPRRRDRTPEPQLEPSPA